MAQMGFNFHRQGIASVMVSQANNQDPCFFHGLVMEYQLIQMFQKGTCWKILKPQVISRRYTWDIASGNFLLLAVEHQHQYIVKILELNGHRFNGVLEGGIPPHIFSHLSILFWSRMWRFPRMGVPQNGWFIMEKPVEMDDLGLRKQSYS